MRVLKGTGSRNHFAPWNKGEHLSESYRSKISKALTGVASGKGATIETELARRNNISKTMIRKGCGGYRLGSGRGRKGWYQGVWCDSSWELAWCLYALDNGIVFERNTKRFPYQYHGKEKYWIPDFKTIDGYLEVKGYFTEQCKAKVSSFQEKLVVLGADRMNPILNYVKEKYGKDFIRLYSGGLQESGLSDLS